MKVKRENIRGYWGMNHEAARELHIKHLPKENEVFVDKSLHGRKLRQVIVHEEVEANLMKREHLKYKDAHRIANKFEKNMR